MLERVGLIAQAEKLNGIRTGAEQQNIAADNIASPLKSYLLGLYRRLSVWIEGPYLHALAKSEHNESGQKNTGA